MASPNASEDTVASPCFQTWIWWICLVSLPLVLSETVQVAWQMRVEHPPTLNSETEEPHICRSLPESPSPGAVGVALPEPKRVLLLFLSALAVGLSSQVCLRCSGNLSSFLAFCSPAQPCLVFSSHRLPVAACLGLEMLQEGAASSVALEENPARMLPAKTRSARPVGALDRQLPRVS